MILHRDGASAFWKIGLDSRQLGGVSEEGQIVDRGKNYKKIEIFLETRNKSNTSLAILSYKEVNIQHTLSIWLHVFCQCLAF